MTTDTQDRVTAEIVRVHDFFVSWFGGTCPDDDETWASRFADHMSSDLLYVMPGGAAFGRDALLEGLRGQHGNNPDFRIRISDVRVRWTLGEVVVVTYVEWQKSALASTPPDNGRTATVLLRDRGDAGFEWLHLHETWLPAEAMAAGDYDF